MMTLSKKRRGRMATEDLCDRGQTMFAEGLADRSEQEVRAELQQLFGDLAKVTRGSDLEKPLRSAYNSLAPKFTRREERERETAPNLEQALKAVVG